MMSQNPKQEALSLVLSALVKTDIDYWIHICYCKITTATNNGDKISMMATIALAHVHK
jgi:ferredoxin-thioredoxin reductase catalytic subunit